MNDRLFYSESIVEFSIILILMVLLTIVAGSLSPADNSAQSTKEPATMQSTLSG